MGKSADKLHKLAMSPHTTMDEAETLKYCKRLLDECERVLKRAEAHYRILPEDMDEPGSVMHDMTTVLAKLRGEA